MPNDAEADAQPQDDRVLPWTVKNMPRERRDAINAAARRADMSVAEFIWASCEAKIRDDRIPLSAPARHPGTSLVAAETASPGGPSAVDDLAKLADVALKLSVDEGKETAVLKAARRAVMIRLEALG